jgi:hypothetical protein
MPITGACRCGGVTYQLVCEALPVTYVCHCLDCQTWSGSAFAEHALLAEDAIQLDGETVTYKHGREGFLSEQIICRMCHTRIYNGTALCPA